MIHVTDFKKAYGSTLAVAGLTFHVQPHQVWGLVGHNGAGKTTTLRAISGLLPPSQGTLSVAGFDVTEEPLQATLRGDNVITATGDHHDKFHRNDSRGEMRHLGEAVAKSSASRSEL